MERIAVIDFETTGIYPEQPLPRHGNRRGDPGAGQIVDRYQSLMNAGVRVPGFIEPLTGISNAMLRSAPPAERVMNEVNEFVGMTPLVAHNAAFDQKFWDFELGLIRRTRVQKFACSLLLARRLMPAAPNHKLGTLTTYANCPTPARLTGPWPMRKWPPTSRAPGPGTAPHPRLRECPTSCCARLQKVPAAKINEHLKKHRGF